MSAGAPDCPLCGRPVEITGLRFAWAERVALVGARIVRLTRAESDLLAVFIKRPSQLVTHDQLAAALYGGNPPDSADQVVKTVITRLRNKLRPEVVFEILWGEGFICYTPPPRPDAAA